MSLSTFPRRLGNTRPARSTEATTSRSRSASRRTSTARPHSGNAVLAVGLHPRGGHRPHQRRQVELLPRRHAHLPRARRRQHQQLEGQLRPGPRLRDAHARQRRADLAVRQRREVADHPRAFGQRRRDRLAGRVVAPVALRDRPAHDDADAPAHPLRGLVLGRPDRLQRRHHVGRRHPVDALVADVRVGVTAAASPATSAPSSRRPSRPHDGSRSPARSPRRRWARPPSGVCPVAGRRPRGRPGGWRAPARGLRPAGRA